MAGKTGSVRDAVLVNAAGAIAAHGGFSADLHADLAASLGRAAEAIDSGKAAALLSRWVELSTSSARLRRHLLVVLSHASTPARDPARAWPPFRSSPSE